MSLRLLIAIGATALATGALGLYFLLSVSYSKPKDVFVDSFPDSNSTTTTQATSTSSNTIGGLSGAFFSATPLVTNPETNRLTDYTYVLTEDPETYDIFYFPETHVLTIMLYKKPLAYARALAESKLRSVLPNSMDELCDIEVKVTTNAYVDPIYDGLNLGLSFCPGSVSLD